MKINSKKVKNALKILITLLVISLLFVVLRFAFFVNWSFNVSDYCQKKAEKIVGNYWAITVPPNDAEKNQFPDLDEISIGFREQLKYEHNPKVLEKFPGWF